MPIITDAKIIELAKYIVLHGGTGEHLREKFGISHRQLRQAKLTPLFIQTRDRARQLLQGKALYEASLGNGNADADVDTEPRHCQTDPAVERFFNQRDGESPS